VEAIRRYVRLRDLGFPPSAIKLLLQASEGAPFPVAPGVTLVVSQTSWHRERPTAPLLEKIAQVLTSILKEPSMRNNTLTKTSDPLAAFTAGAFTPDRKPVPLVSTRFDVEIIGGLAVVEARPHLPQ
jgi:hypothetical protein